MHLRVGNMFSYLSVQWHFELNNKCCYLRAPWYVSIQWHSIVTCRVSSASQYRHASFVQIRTNNFGFILHSTDSNQPSIVVLESVSLFTPLTFSPACRSPSLTMTVHRTPRATLNEVYQRSHASGRIGGCCETIKPRCKQR